MADNGSEPISADELQRLGKALKDDKFRQMLIEYADEIRDPQNRKRYEQELSILERERGVDLTFVHPEAGFVIKTSTIDGTKTFVNICKNKNVGKPSCSRSKTKPGLDWSIPYFLSPPRDDVDKSGRKCRLFDAVFHPDTVYMAQRNARFYKMIEDTAIEGIQQKFCVTLDRKNVHYPKLKYKGHPFPTVLRKPVTDIAVTELTEKIENANLNAEESQLQDRIDYNVPPTEEIKINNSSVEPKYSIRYRNKVDMEDYTYLSQQNANLRPDEMVIDIQLPFSDSAKGVDLDVIDQTLVLKSDGTVSYNLELPLPFPVYDDQGKAQFHQLNHTLTVTLPIRPFEICTALETKEVPNERETLSEESVNTADPLKTDSLSTNKPNTDTSDLKELLKEVSAEERHEEKLVLERCNCCIMGHLCLPSHAYDLPNFNVNQCDKELTFLFKVPKIHVESVETQICDCGLGLQVVFTSTLDTNWYSFCMVSDDHIQLKELQNDVSDFNMILQVSKAQPKEWKNFSYGCYEAVGDVYTFVNTSSTFSKFEKLKDDTQEYINEAVPIENEHVQVKEVTEESLKLQIGVSDGPNFTCEADTEEDFYDNDMVEVVRKTRSSSESSQDLCPLPIRRGILKYPRNWRSISESSDDFNCWSSLDVLTPSPEDDDSVLTDRIPKKNVRFNDHVAKNIFRANSSILGQKKKNQKRAEYKKRVADRSSSQEESESHDSTATTEEESENTSSKGKQSGKQKKKKKNLSKSSNKSHKNGNVEEKLICANDILDSLVAESNRIDNRMTNGEDNDVIREEGISLTDKDEEEQNGVSEDTFDASTEQANKMKSENKVLRTFLGTSCDDAESTFCERTDGEMMFDLDFRTNHENVIHLAPENTAFHLD